jgi:hypothetical protein
VAMGNTGYSYDAAGSLTNVSYPSSHSVAMRYVLRTFLASCFLPNWHRSVFAEKPNWHRIW